MIDTGFSVKMRLLELEVATSQEALLVRFYESFETKFASLVALATDQ